MKLNGLKIFPDPLIADGELLRVYILRIQVNHMRNLPVKMLNSKGSFCSSKYMHIAHQAIQFRI